MTQSVQQPFLSGSVEEVPEVSHRATLLKDVEGSLNWHSGGLNTPNCSNCCGVQLIELPKREYPKPQQSPKPQLPQLAKSQPVMGTMPGGAPVRGSVMESTTESSQPFICAFQERMT
ncbi:MAG: hypothetical protein HY210_07095 [Candidatus Omnitrophica bacterium]|nr:hypothetical protein [Candidatus Omnitrophota bacterium]